MMTIMLKKDFENRSLEEIVKERNKLILELNEYEDKYIFNENINDNEIVEKPSPKTIYSVKNENLIMLTELIIKKLRN